MLPIILASFVWLPALIGLGWFLTQLGRSGPDPRPLRRLALSGIHGLFVISILGIVANFVMPTYPILPVMAAAAGWLILLLRRRQCLAGMAPWHLIAAALTLLMVAIPDARGRIGYDTGLYHLQAVQWITAGPAPQGLANLHARLGYNSAWFCAAAMLEGPLLLGKSVFLLHAFLLTFFAWAIVDAAHSLICRGYRRSDAMLLGAALPWAVFGISDLACSLYTDLPVMLLTCLVCSMWLDPDDQRGSFEHAVTLSVFAVMLKLSALPLLAGAVVMWLHRSYHQPGRVARWVTLWCGALAAWMCRGVVLSGCLLFPSTLGRMGFLPWAVPAQRADQEAQTIRSWAKYHALPQQVAPGEPWVGAWLARNARNRPIDAAFVTAVAGLVLWGLRALLRGRRPDQTSAPPPWRPILFIAATGAAYWFANAPDVRFGFGYIWCGAFALLCIGLEAWPIRTTPATATILAGAAAVVLLACGNFFWKLNRVSVVPWPSIPAVPLRVCRTVDGVAVYVPALPDDRAWAAPLPSTPTLDPALRCAIGPDGRCRRFWIGPTP